MSETALKLPPYCKGLPLGKIPTGEGDFLQPRVWHYMELPERFTIGPDGEMVRNPEYRKAFIKAQPPLKLLARVEFQVALDHLGPKRCQRLMDCLAEVGLKLRHQPKVWPVPKVKIERPVSEKRISAAIRLLNRCGYTITKAEVQ